MVNLHIIRYQVPLLLIPNCLELCKLLKTILCFVKWINYIDLNRFVYKVNELISKLKLKHYLVTIWVFTRKNAKSTENGERILVFVLICSIIYYSSSLDYSISPIAVHNMFNKRLTNHRWIYASSRRKTQPQAMHADTCLPADTIETIKNYLKSTGRSASRSFSPGGEKVALDLQPEIQY